MAKIKNIVTKTDLIINSVPDTNKIKASDINEIVSVINENDDLKTSKGGYEGTTQGLKDYVDEKDFNGVTTVNKINDLPNNPIPANGTTYRIGDADDPIDNGNWYVANGAWKKSTTLVDNFSNSDDISKSGDELIISERQKTVNNTKGFLRLPLDFDFTQDLSIYDNYTFEIIYNFDLGGVERVFPDNLELLFNGGKISNGTITASYLTVKSPIVPIFGTDVLFTNRLKNTHIYFEWFGAIGDGVIDDYNSLNAALKTQMPIFWLDKVYATSQTLIITNQRGVRWVGLGSGSDFLQDGIVNRIQSVLLYIGADGGDLVEMAGVTRVVIDSISFSGKDRLDRTKTGNLFRLKEGTGSIPTGNFVLKNTFWCHAENAIKCGEVNGDINIADFYASHTLGTNLNNLLLVNHDQGLNFNFQYVAVSLSDNIFNFVRGGSLMATTVTCTGTTNALTIEKGGRNVGIFNMTDVSLEHSSAGQQSIRIVNIPDANGAYESNVVVQVTTFKVTNESTATGFNNEIHNGARVMFQSGFINDTDFINATGITQTNRTRVTLDNVTFVATKPDITDYITTDNFTTLDVRNNCHDQLGLTVTTDFSRFSTNNVELTAENTWYTALNVKMGAYGASVLRIYAGNIIQGVGLRQVLGEYYVYRSGGAVINTAISAFNSPVAGLDFQFIAGSSNEFVDLQVRRTVGGATISTTQVVVEVLNSDYDIKNFRISNGSS